MNGSLVCVGTGMTLGAHISPISRSHIENADVVFSLMSNSFVAQWIHDMNSDVRSLHPFYEEGKNRNQSYQEMVNAILDEIRAGKKVVAAFYGHPGVFACVAHKAIAKAQQENYSAYMEAGISAEDCLYADLCIDPGKTGCANYEASQFMFYKRKIDTAAYLILWQVGIAGDKSLAKFSTGSAYRKVLVDLLTESYPSDHEVILYKAKVIAIEDTEINRVKLCELSDMNICMHTTLVVPPYTQMIRNKDIEEKLRQLEQKELNAQPKLKLVPN